MDKIDTDKLNNLEEIKKQLQSLKKKQNDTFFGMNITLSNIWVETNGLIEKLSEINLPLKDISKLDASYDREDMERQFNNIINRIDDLIAPKEESNIKKDGKKSLTIEECLKDYEKEDTSLVLS